MSHKTTSIEGLLVKFVSVIRNRIGKKTRCTHYKLRAQVKTSAGEEKQEYWYVEKSRFLRQKSAGVGTAMVRIRYNEKQRLAIAGLVANFEKNSKN